MEHPLKNIANNSRGQAKEDAAPSSFKLQRLVKSLFHVTGSKGGASPNTNKMVSEL